MKKHIQYFTFTTLLLTAAAITACNKSDSGSNAVPVATTATQTCINGLCYYNYGTPTQTTTTSSLSFTAQTSNAANGSMQPIGSLTIQPGMQTMLYEAMGVCDIAASTGGSSSGMAACSAWVAGTHEISIQLPNGTSPYTRLMVRSYPQVNNYWNYSVSLPSLSQFLLGMVGIPTVQSTRGQFDPMILAATNWPTNNNQGFELRANGPTNSWASNKLLQLIVTNGSTDAASFNFNLYYNAQLAASGTMARCQSYNCNFLY
jgi:hypothetical protein